MVTFFPAGPHLSMGFDEDEDGRRGGMGVEQLTGEGRKHSLKGQMTNCPVLLSSPLQPAPPLLVAGGTGWAGGEWCVQLVCPPSLAPGEAGVLRNGIRVLGMSYLETLRNETPFKFKRKRRRLQL